MVQKSCVLAWPLDGAAIRKVVANHPSDSAGKMTWHLVRSNFRYEVGDFFEQEEVVSP